MRFDAEEWKRLSREDFEKAWHRGPETLTPPKVAEMSEPGAVPLSSIFQIRTQEWVRS